jgi:hypothetical protein
MATSHMPQPHQTGYALIASPLHQLDHEILTKCTTIQKHYNRHNNFLAHVSKH